VRIEQYHEKDLIGGNRENRGRKAVFSVSSVHSCSIFFSDISWLGGSLLNSHNIKEDKTKNTAADQNQKPVTVRGKSEGTIES
jgi:hypothetical protein